MRIDKNCQRRPPSIVCLMSQALPSLFPQQVQVPTSLMMTRRLILWLSSAPADPSTLPAHQRSTYQRTSVSGLSQKMTFCRNLHHQKFHLHFQDVISIGFSFFRHEDTNKRTKVSCCDNSLKLAVSFEFKNRVSRTRLNETCLNPPLHYLFTLHYQILFFFLLGM